MLVIWFRKFITAEFYNNSITMLENIKYYRLQYYQQCNYNVKNIKYNISRIIQWNNIGLWFGALRINRSPGSHPLHWIGLAILSKLYKRPMEGTQFVHWDSYHTLASRKAIHFSQLLRLKRNSTFEMDFRREATTLLKLFRNRGPFTVLQATARKPERFRDRTS